MEGRMDAVQREVGEVKTGMADGFRDLKALLEKVEHRLDAIDARESERKGATRIIVWVAGAVGAVASLFVSVVIPFLIDLFTGP